MRTFGPASDNVDSQRRRVPRGRDGKRVAIPGGRRGRAGVTLIEIIFACAILVFALCATYVFFMKTVERNRQTSMQVAGLQAINGIVSEIEDLADSATDKDTLAYTVVRHFDEKLGEKIAIGPNGSLVDRVEQNATEGCLIYRFWIPSPGSPLYAESDSRFAPNRLAVGEMRIYLDENTLNGTVLPAGSWSDLNNVPVVADSGVDLDLNGEKNDNLLFGYATVKQLALGFKVTFYSDYNHKAQVYSCSRDVFLTRMRDAVKKFDPTKG